MPRKSNIPIRKRAVVGVILRHNTFLTIRRSQQVVAPGKVCFPGGSIEPGESEPDALVREIREELGVEAMAGTRLFETVTHWGTSVAWWHARVEENVQFVLQAAEVAEARWLTPQTLLRDPDLLSSNRDFLVAWRQATFAIPGIAVPHDWDETSG
ncbi:NUDIX domain-containing protein [Bremerella sp. JC770]|uniref:NUDIX domain-containing protein n=1 Tax=Bremerella sp. JC770 TaxID=3232137 RepID=UPI00345B0B8D